MQVQKNKARFGKFKRGLRWLPHKFGFIRWSPIDNPNLVLWYDYYQGAQDFQFYNRALTDKEMKRAYEWSTGNGYPRSYPEILNGKDQAESSNYLEL